jgi:hypothetical protein
MLEFGSVGQFFLVLLLGITEFPRPLWIWEVIARATHAGMRLPVTEALASDDGQSKKFVVNHDPYTGTSSEPVVPGLTGGDAQFCHRISLEWIFSGWSLADTI